MAKTLKEKVMDEEQALIERAKKLMEKAKQLREAKIYRAGKAAEAFHKNGFADIEKFKHELDSFFGKQ